MYEPAWKRLVEGLKEQGFESRYLDRLWDRLSPGARQIAAASGYDMLKREIMEEMGYALRQAEEKVNLAMLLVELTATAIEENRDPSETEPLAAKYRHHRESAIRARWEFMVHREAIGLIAHGVLDELYPLPPTYEQLRASSTVPA